MGNWDVELDQNKDRVKTELGMSEEISREEIAALLARESMSEEMTREEAIKILTNIRNSFDSMKENTSRFVNAYDMAIAALEAQKPSCKTCKHYTPGEYHTDSIVPYVLHIDLGCPLNECVNAYEKAIEYLRSKANMKG